MSETIYKYVVPLTDTFDLELPASVQYCLFAEQHGGLCVWIRLDPDAPKQTWTFHVRGTGHPLPEGRALYHIGSCLAQEGRFVWHLFLDQGPLGAVTVIPYTESQATLSGHFYSPESDITRAAERDKATGEAIP